MTLALVDVRARMLYASEDLAPASCTGEIVSTPVAYSTTICFAALYAASASAHRYNEKESARLSMSLESEEPYVSPAPRSLTQKSPSSAERCSIMTRSGATSASMALTPAVVSTKNADSMEARGAMVI